MIAASNGHLLAFDNLSTVRLSDEFSRLATGAGFSTRTLYENREEEIFSAARPVILNGIPELPQSQTSLPGPSSCRYPRSTTSIGAMRESSSVPSTRPARDCLAPSWISFRCHPPLAPDLSAPFAAASRLCDLGVRRGGRVPVATGQLPVRLRSELVTARPTPPSTETSSPRPPSVWHRGSAPLKSSCQPSTGWPLKSRSTTETGFAHRDRSGMLYNGFHRLCEPPASSTLFGERDQSRERKRLIRLERLPLDTSATSASSRDAAPMAS